MKLNTFKMYNKSFVKPHLFFYCEKIISKKLLILNILLICLYFHLSLSLSLALSLSNYKAQYNDTNIIHQFFDGPFLDLFEGDNISLRPVQGNALEAVASILNSKVCIQNKKIFLAFSMFKFIKVLKPKFSQHNANK